MARAKQERYTFEYEKPLEKFPYSILRVRDFKAKSDAAAVECVVAFVSRPYVIHGTERYARPRTLIAEQAGVQIALPWERFPKSASNVVTLVGGNAQKSETTIACFKKAQQK